MRWLDRTHGLSQRVIKRFALFPVYCKGELRWLETFYMLQKRSTSDWYNARWATKEEYIAWCQEIEDTTKE